MIPIDIRRTVSLNPLTFETYTIGSSDCNQYLPYYCIYAHTLLSFETISVIEYKFPIAPNRYSYTRKYSDLFSWLEYTSIPMQYRFKVGDVEHRLNVFKGMIYDEDGEILLCQTVDSDYLMNTSMNDIIANPNVRAFKLILSNKLETNEIYKNVRKKIELEVQSRFKSSNMDIILTNNVNDLVFKNNYTPPVFTDIVESMDYLNEEIPKLMLI